MARKRSKNEDSSAKSATSAAGDDAAASPSGPGDAEASAEQNAPREPSVVASGDDRQPDRKQVRPIVGIGASAGGLAALKQFFAHVPDDSGLTFVVVVHLLPDHQSHLAELLQPHVKMPIEQVTDTVALEPDRVYVIPPNANLSTIDSHLRLTELEPRRQERAPIDHFFRTLATTHEGQAIGVVLSGTGSDGTLGLREIKAKGGLTVVQDPSDAEYDGMPQSAIIGALVDMVLPVARIPASIIAYVQTRPNMLLPEEDELADRAHEELLRKVFALLRTRTGRDFSRYKRATVLRRIQRRMQLRQLEDLGEYVTLLRGNADEVHTLADDLLVTVTSFFRDSDVFETLESEVIPQLFAEKGPDDCIRVWTVGCATGEEAYSLAILLIEYANTLDHPPTLQVFASDLHARSLELAREGFYPGDIKADVSPARLARFFQREEGGYRIRQEVRECVVFAPHNILVDPPFSRLDLVSCRNLLIYLQRDIQKEVIELFHYALLPDAYLLLGTSETLESTDLFRTDDKKRCIYRKRNVPAPEPRLPVFPVAPVRQSGAGPPRTTLSEPVAYGVMHQRMLERYGPPSMLIGPDDKLVHLSQRGGRYLVHPGGEVTTSVIKLVRAELQLELRAALQTARQEGEEVDTRPVVVRFDGHTALVKMHVRPGVDLAQPGYALVIFEELPAPASKAGSAQAERGSDGNQQRETSELLEAELGQSRQRLQRAIEEYETSQEELRASNEELQSANEELRSTLEELETSKEELQSMNEELQTVNQENRHKVEELAQLSDDLQNLMASTDIATLFLDRELRILRFTPKASELFNVRPADRGRPLADFTHRLGYDDLTGDAQQVLAKLIPIAREVQDDQQQWYLARVLPYRSSDDQIRGVVITFVDISAQKHGADALQESERRYRSIVNQNLVGILQIALDGRILWVNEQFCRRLGYAMDDIEGRGIQDIVHPDDLAASLAGLETMATDGSPFELDKRLVRRDGSVVWVHNAISPEFDASGQLASATIVSLDVSKRRQAEQALRDSQKQLQELNESLEEQVARRTAMLKMLQDITRAANESRTVEAAMQAALQRIASYNGWQVGHVWRLAEDGSRRMASHSIWHVESDMQQAVGNLDAFRRLTEQIQLGYDEGLIGRVMATGKPQWIDDIATSDLWMRGDARDFGLHAVIAFPIKIDDEVVAIMEFFSDHPASRDERFMEIMPDVGIQLGHVIRRKRLDRRVADATEQEQRRIGQDIHDGIGQEIAGLKYLAQTHCESLQQKASEDAELAQRIAIGFETIQLQLRRIIRDLVPVEVDKQGLAAALRLLAQRTADDYGLNCRFECDDSVHVEDSMLATHVYRIAQEAVSNAAKHAQAQQVWIRVEADSETLHLTVADDGIGIALQQPPNSKRFGLRGMSHRAELVGGQLRVEQRRDGGTIVECRVPLQPQE